ncbi:hypothetical protein EYF80_039935 [Liparis tanakae]|uniref:Uncharacterized protein n=1 Tax=Liparis tanakae TaxID=230148 RepID=A0A4Z2GA74_9TELE|nr:hypothetical protein EYF80_039935 [Liparis tanakae]
MSQLQCDWLLPVDRSKSESREGDTALCSGYETEKPTQTGSETQIKIMCRSAESDWKRSSNYCNWTARKKRRRRRAGVVARKSHSGTLTTGLWLSSGHHHLGCFITSDHSIILLDCVTPCPAKYTNRAALVWHQQRGDTPRACHLLTSAYPGQPSAAGRLEEESFTSYSKHISRKPCAKCDGFNLSEAILVVQQSFFLSSLFSKGDSCSGYHAGHLTPRTQSHLQPLGFICHLHHAAVHV